MEEKRDGRPRIVEANRLQMRLVPMDLEGLLAEDHPARAVWSFVERLDLSEFLERIRAREGTAGRPATDPRILLGLWILGTLDGVGAAREIERLTQEHLAYQWMCGGVHVNHHTLSDFRNLSSDQLNHVLTQSAAALLNEGLVEMQSVAQDGMKVRASAGGSSFRKRERLEKLQRIVREQVETLAREIEDDGGAASKRKQSARKRAAESRARRVERALEEMNKAQRGKKTKDKKRRKDVKTSVTDPEARIMRMADGGFRPAYNVHLATAVHGKVIVAAAVNNEGTDSSAMVDLEKQIETRHGAQPKNWLADGGCVSHDNVNQMSERGCKVYAPVRASQSSSRKPTEARSRDSAAVREWRERMNSDEAKEIYKKRGETAEWVNAQFRAQGLLQFLVRGAQKALAVVLIHAITHNLRRAWALT